MDCDAGGEASLSLSGTGVAVGGDGGDCLSFSGIEEAEGVIACPCQGLEILQGEVTAEMTPVGMEFCPCQGLGQVGQEQRIEVAL